MNAPGNGRLVSSRSLTPAVHHGGLGGAVLSEVSQSLRDKRQLVLHYRRKLSRQP